MSSAFVLTTVSVLQILTISSGVRLGIREIRNPVTPFTIPAKGLYEIVAAGASGGGNINAPGGRGGIAAGIRDFEANDELFISIGVIGENSGDLCGGAGGGGATIVYTKLPKNFPGNELLLVGPGGGGAGYNQKPYEPDWLELNTPVFGTCDPCVSGNVTCAAAAPGKNIAIDTNLLNVTYNPSDSYNYTRGCYGGFGGGGQGGAWRDVTNKTTSGGGGGGGGFPGGLVGTKENAKSCSAGGPGKAFCKMKYCNVTRLNEDIDGYFLIKLHEPYKELPNRDRTNYERPYVPQQDGSGGHNLIINYILLVASVIIYELFTYG